MQVCAYTIYFSDRTTNYFKYVGSEFAFYKIFYDEYFLISEDKIKS